MSIVQKHLAIKYPATKEEEEEEELREPASDTQL